MAKSKFGDRLSGMKQGWDESQNQYDSMFGGVKIDAGDYIARVQSLKLVEAKSSGKLMVRREHLIIEGSWKGTVVYDNMMLETSMGLTFLRRWFEQMGYDAPEDPAEIEDIIESIAEEAPTVKIAVKHSGEYINVAVIEVIEDDDAQEVEKVKPEKKAEKKTSAKSAKQNKKVDKKEPVEEEEEEEEEAEAEAEAESPIEEPSVEEDAENADLLKDMFAFCKAQDIDTEPDDDVEILGERIKEYKWPEAELTEDELEMFEAAEITDCIKRKVAAKKKKTKA